MGIPVLRRLRANSAEVSKQFCELIKSVRCLRKIPKRRHSVRYGSTWDSGVAGRTHPILRILNNEALPSGQAQTILRSQKERRIRFDWITIRPAEDAFELLLYTETL